MDFGRYEQRQQRRQTRRVRRQAPGPIGYIKRALRPVCETIGCLYLRCSTLVVPLNDASS